MNNKKKISLILGVTLLGTIGASITLAKTGTVTTETIRMRAKPSTDSKIVEMANQGEKIEILGEENGWYKVSYKNKEGYMSKEYLKENAEKTTSSPTATPTATPSTTPSTTPAASETPKPSTTPEAPVQSETPVPSQTPESTPATPVAEKKLGNVTNRATDTYLTPNFSSVKISKIEQGKTVAILKTMGNWSKITIENKEAWIPNSILMVEVANGQQQTIPTSTVPETTPEPTKEPDTQQTNANNINKAGYISSNGASNMRSAPSTNSETIQSLPRHTVVTVISEENNWYKISYNGKEGYVSKPLVTIGEPPADVSSRGADISKVSNQTQVEPQTTQTSASAPASSTGNAVSIAQSYVGSKYVSGGSSPSSGFDCSGFTQYVYGQCGKTLSRTSSSQANSGTSISKSELQPGDLLLFHYYGSSTIDHVGIYVGNGQFIHAANAKRGVVYDTIESGYYAQNYVGARRL